MTCNIMGNNLGMVRNVNFEFTCLSDPHTYNFSWKVGPARWNQFLKGTCDVGWKELEDKYYKVSSLTTQIQHLG